MTLRTRLVLAFAYVLVVVLVILEIPLTLNVAGRVDTEVRAEAANEAHLIAATASGRLSEQTDLDRIAARAASDIGGRVVIVDAEGLLRADSAGGGLRGSSYLTRPEIDDVLASGQTIQGERFSDTLETDILFTAVPILEEGLRVGAVRVTQSLEDVNREVGRDIVALIGIGLAALAVGIVVAWLLAGTLARPMRALAKTAHRVAAGDLEARATVQGSAEQKEVATAFNEMAQRLGDALATQRSFVANASHQLRTPLTGLRLRLEAAAVETDDPAAREHILVAEQEAERLGRLVSDLLVLASGDEDVTAGEPVSLSLEADRARERWQRPAAEAGQELVLVGEGDVVALSSSHDAAVVLDNLIENALVYGGDGGTVSIVWGHFRGDAYLAVLDEGPGLAGDDAERLFDRFARGTAGQHAEGTGLGLSVVRTLAQRWGGDARITTRTTGGACAEVTLPALPDAEQASGPEAEPVQEPAGRGSHA
ncbi:MAG: ATP-binding protein [Gaiellales bacterium]